MTPIQEYLHPDQTLHEAILLMNKYRLNTLPVVDSSKKLIGVFTRSILYHMLLTNKKMETQNWKFYQESHWDHIRRHFCGKFRRTDCCQ